MDYITILQKINTSAFCDHSLNKATDSEVADYAVAVRQEFGIELDPDFLDFLKMINGFEINGFNFYGTKEQPNLYVSESLQQNRFWLAEITELKKYWLIGDGDMDFYCFSPEEKIYKVLTKASLANMEVHTSFHACIIDIIQRFGQRTYPDN